MKSAWGTQTLALAKLDFYEVLRSRWLLACVTLYGLMAVGFMVVALHESDVIAFTGTSRVLLAFCHALLLLLPLLALLATGQTVNQARAEGSLELLLSNPFSRLSYFSALALVRFSMLALPLLLLLLSLGLGSAIAGQGLEVLLLLRCLAVTLSLLLCFTGLGLWVATAVTNPARAAMVLLLVWLLSVAFLDFALAGLMLQWQIEPRVVFVLAALNPVQAARMALLSALQPDLAILGPVGFYLANRVGSGVLTLLGIAWPALLGLSAWWSALRRFEREDLI